MDGDQSALVTIRMGIDMFMDKFTGCIVSCILADQCRPKETGDGRMWMAATKALLRNAEKWDECGRQF